MAKARSLADLLRIRAANAKLLDRVDGHLGTALGFKTVKGEITTEPCVTVFVPKKVAEPLVPKSQRVPKELQGPDGLTCATDVVTGAKADGEPPSPPLDEKNQQIVEELQSGTLGIIGGIQLAFFEGGAGFVGTAACVVSRGPKKGLLTNQHVGGSPGRPIYHPDPGRYRIGFTRASVAMDPDEYYLNHLIDEENAYYRIDCAFIELQGEALELAQPGLHELGPIGKPLPLDLGTMGPLGTKVISIGRTRGIQRGTIVAFGYEFNDQDESVYTDYLIIGERAGVPFSDHGDSGKLIVTDDAKKNAVALLWGGWSERLRKGHGQENWTYAIDVNKPLKQLGLTIEGGS
jgi:hypothetical protein